MTVPTFTSENVPAVRVIRALDKPALVAIQREERGGLVTYAYEVEDRKATLIEDALALAAENYAEATEKGGDLGLSRSLMEIGNAHVVTAANYAARNAL